MALALNAMGDKFQAVLDLTIVHPDGIPTFWHFLQGKVRRIVVRARLLPVTRELVDADYCADRCAPRSEPGYSSCGAKRTP